MSDSNISFEGRHLLIARNGPDYEEVPTHPNTPSAGSSFNVSSEKQNNRYSTIPIDDEREGVLSFDGDTGYNSSPSLQQNAGYNPHGASAPVQSIAASNRRYTIGARRSSRSLNPSIVSDIDGSTANNTPKTPAFSVQPLSLTSTPGLEDGSFGFDKFGSQEPLIRDPFESSRPPNHSRGVSFGTDTYIGDSRTNLTHREEKDWTPGQCTSRHEIDAPSSSRLSIMVVMLAVYSTLMSALWLIVAIYQPRWGHNIRSDGFLTPSTASLLSALLAKTIELSFVTVFVTFIGQVLSRRSLVKSSRGVTLAEFSMRTWVIQPGALLTHSNSLKYAGWTILGVGSLIATIAAMFYTTASDALVSPKLKFGGWDRVVMEGYVEQSYGNIIAIMGECQSPITVTDDPLHSGESCIALEHSGSATHNYVGWLTTWAAVKAHGVGSSANMTSRPPATAILYDNTTVTGNWIEESSMADNNNKYLRVINNVTLAMPHAGVIAAARLSQNDIIQPGGLQGSGEYRIKAAVPSPSINVICANANSTELAPMIYVNFPNARTKAGDLPNQVLPVSDWESDLVTAAGVSRVNNRTTLDEIFKWGPAYNRKAPVFPLLPIDFNGLLYSRTVQGWGDSVYYLTKADSAKTSNYTICSLRSFLSPNCSTLYNVTGTSSGFLSAYCEDSHDKNNYLSSIPTAPKPYQGDWADVGYSWALALGLGDGYLSANASTSRLLAQLIPTTPALPLLIPSLAEALAVSAGSTLLQSSLRSPFVHYWDPPALQLNPGIYQAFNASIQSQQYTSGFVQQWQGIFYLILLLVFAVNVVCLVYFIIRKGLITDFTECQNLFALAVNSPPSDALAGSCGAGPEGRELGVKWGIGRQDDGHYFVSEKSGSLGGSPATGRSFSTGRRWRGKGERYGASDSESGIGLGLWKKNPKGLKVSSSYEMLSNRKRSWL